jgi:hypothetical protein
MVLFHSFQGTIIKIDNFPTGSEINSGCYQIMSIKNSDGNLVNFIVTPFTYFIDQVMVRVGDAVTGYYDANAAVPFIYPPQLQAIVMARDTLNQNIEIDYFNSQLVSSDGTLKLNIDRSTQIVLENGQMFLGEPANRNLIVIYGATTRSIPPQTTPYKIIVMCM